MVLKLGSSGIIITIVQMKKLSFPKFKYLTEEVDKKALWITRAKRIDIICFQILLLNLSLALVYIKFICCYGNRAWRATSIVIN